MSREWWIGGLTELPWGACQHCRVIHTERHPVELHSIDFHGPGMATNPLGEWHPVPQRIALWLCRLCGIQVGLLPTVANAQVWPSYSVDGPMYAHMRAQARGGQGPKGTAQPGAPLTGDQSADQA